MWLELHVTYHHNSELQTTLVSKPSILMPDEDEKSCGSLVLDFGIWWRNMKMIYNSLQQFATNQLWNYPSNIQEAEDERMARAETEQRVQRLSLQLEKLQSQVSQGDYKITNFDQIRRWW